VRLFYHPRCENNVIAAPNNIAATTRAITPAALAQLAITDVQNRHRRA
jgi:hypothetical protein